MLASHAAPVHADDGLEKGSSETSTLSHWDEPENDSASFSLSEWEGSASETDSSGQISSPQQEPEAAGSASSSKRSTLAEMLRLGQLDTTAKPERLHPPVREARLADPPVCASIALRAASSVAKS